MCVLEYVDVVPHDEMSIGGLPAVHLRTACFGGQVAGGLKTRRSEARLRLATADNLLRRLEGISYETFRT